MRETKTEVIPERTQERHRIVCDLCNKATDWQQDWTSDMYAIAETEIRLSTGTRYPECSNREDTVFDVCPECFQGKVIPALVALGMTPRSEEHSW